MAGHGSRLRGIFPQEENSLDFSLLIVESQTPSQQRMSSVSWAVKLELEVTGVEGAL